MPFGIYLRRNYHHANCAVILFRIVSYHFPLTKPRSPSSALVSYNTIDFPISSPSWAPSGGTAAHLVQQAPRSGTATRPSRNKSFSQKLLGQSLPSEIGELYPPIPPLLLHGEGAPPTTSPSSLVWTGTSEIGELYPPIPPHLLHGGGGTAKPLQWQGTCF